MSRVACVELGSQSSVEYHVVELGVKVLDGALGDSESFGWLLSEEVALVKNLTLW